MPSALPTVSIILPNYNHADLVGGAIASILDQGEAGVDLLVIDDGSTDESVATIAAAIHGRPDARLIRNATNQGVVKSLLRGLTEVRGDLILFAAADDRYLPGMIATGRQAAASHPEAALICGNVIGHSEAGEQQLTLPFGDRPRFIAPDEVVARMRRQNFIFFTGATLFRHASLRAEGKLLPAMRWHADWLLEFVLALRHGVYYLPQDMARIRMVAGTYSGGRHDWAEQGPLLMELVAVLQQRYPDLAPKFRQAALLPTYDPAMLSALLTNPAIRDYLTPLLVWRLLSYNFLQSTSSLMPRSWGQRLRPWLRV